MIQAARSALPNTGNLTFANFDVQCLPLLAGAFDLAIANYMLHHVPDLPRAERELRRVLATGGRLYAATLRDGHLRELNALLHEFDLGFPSPHQLAGTLLPRLDNAVEWLRPTFSRIEVFPRADSLWVTEARPVAEYAFSMSSGPDGLAPDRAGELGAFFQSRIRREGGVHIAKAGGIVLAWAD